MKALAAFAPSDGFVFSTGAGEPFDHITLAKVVAKAVAETSITKHVSPHLLRHAQGGGTWDSNGAGFCYHF